MSGPKVVRIVTREEIIAICQGHLARLDAALADWTRTCRRGDLISDTDIAEAERRRDRIGGLLAQNRFLDLQKAAPLEIESLRADKQARLGKAAEAAAAARSVERRTAEAATALLAALRRANRDVPADLATALKCTADGAPPAEGALARGFALLSADAEAGQARTREIAQQLKDKDEDRSFAGWLKANGPEPDPAQVRLERGVAELTQLVGEAAAAVLARRLDTLDTDATQAGSALRRDALSLDLATALEAARARAAAAEAFRLSHAELAMADPAAAGRVAEPAADADPSVWALATKEVEQVIGEARAATAAAARRTAVLEGLAKLGYAVSAEMSTAWAQDGRVVARQPDRPGYGVEIVGRDVSDRLQMRVVSFGEGPVDGVRDRDAETAWCGDVAQLEAALAGLGGSLVIERATPIGTGPVKRVASSASFDTQAREGPALVQRAQD